MDGQIHKKDEADRLEYENSKDRYIVCKQGRTNMRNDYTDWIICEQERKQLTELPKWATDEGYEYVDGFLAWWHNRKRKEKGILYIMMSKLRFNVKK